MPTLLNHHPCGIITKKLPGKVLFEAIRYLADKMVVKLNKIELVTRPGDELRPHDCSSAQSSDLSSSGSLTQGQKFVF